MVPGESMLIKVYQESSTYNPNRHLTPHRISVNPIHPTFASTRAVPHRSPHPRSWGSPQSESMGNIPRQKNVEVILHSDRGFVTLLASIYRYTKVQRESGRNEPGTSQQSRAVQLCNFNNSITTFPSGPKLKAIIE